MNNRQTNPFDPQYDSGFLRFLYLNILGAPLRFLMTRRLVSQLGGAYMDSALSAHRIHKFIKDNHIDMSDYEDRKYRSFNDFFTRKILAGKRPFSHDPNDLCSPADSRLSAFEIAGDSTFIIKGTPYTLSQLLQDEELAKEFEGGTLMVFRLSVDDYHRYAFFDDGSLVAKPRYIKGAFHTVRPIAPLSPGTDPGASG